MQLHKVPDTHVRHWKYAVCNYKHCWTCHSCAHNYPWNRAILLPEISFTRSRQHHPTSLWSGSAFLTSQPTSLCGCARHTRRAKQSGSCLAGYLDVPKRRCGLHECWKRWGNNCTDIYLTLHRNEKVDVWTFTVINRKSAILYAPWHIFIFA